MRRIAFLIVFFGLVLLLAACGGDSADKADSSTDDTEEANTQESSGETVKLSASSGVPDQHFWPRGFFVPLAEAVQEESNGEVEFDLFHAGELVELGNEYDALTSGTIDIAFTLMGPYDPQRFPYSEVVMLPVLDSSAGIVTEAMANLMKSDQEVVDGKTFYELEFGDKGLVAFPNPATEPYVFSTTKQKIESPKDFTQAMRVRTASRVHEIMADDLGITGQSMPITDSYDALSRSALDGIIYNAPDWIAFGFDELIKHTITGVNLGHFIGHTAMTQETWDSLSPEMQDLFEEKANEIVHDGAALTMGETDENIASNIEKGGELTDFSELDPELQEYLEGSIVRTWNAWIENLESQGLGGKEMALLWRDLLLDAGASFPQDILDLE